MQDEIEQAAFAFHQQVEEGERVIVGVNAFEDEPEEPIELLPIDPEAERRQLERMARVRAERTPRRRPRRSPPCARARAATRTCCPLLREALRARCTVGEICEALREEWGMYDAVRVQG